MGEVIKLKVATSEEVISLKSASGSLAVEAVSPRVSFEKVEGGTRLDITDVDGTKSAILPDGATGQTGPAGETGPQGDPGPQGVGIKRVWWSNYSLNIELTDGTICLPYYLRGEKGEQGDDGSDGATFTPSVSSDGTLSWTNDGGRQNPLSVNIKGPQGPQGMQGLRGPGIVGVELLADYTLKIIYQGGGYDIVGPIRGPQGDPGDDYVLTTQDKDDIADAVLAEIGVVAPAITKVVSGNVVSFDDGAEGTPIKSCIVKIDPVQVGSGTPTHDNIRAISGRTSATVSHSGSDTSNPNIFTVNWANDAGTVYGGELTINEDGTGTLVVTHAIITIDGSLTPSEINTSANYTSFRVTHPNCPYWPSAGPDSVVGAVSNWASETSQYYGHFPNNIGGPERFALSQNYYQYRQIGIGITPTVTDETGIKSYLNANPLVICYPLRTPTQSYPVTAEQIVALTGQNNIWADCGNVRVEYFVDTKAYIDRKADKVVIETVSGTDPVITGVDNHRYVCGTVDTLTLTPPSSGIVDVVFTSGTTPTVLNVHGDTVKWPDWFNPSALEASATYEINILYGTLGMVGIWT